MKRLIFIALILFFALPCAGQEEGWWVKTQQGFEFTTGESAYMFWWPDSLPPPDSVWVVKKDWKGSTTFWEWYWKNKKKNWKSVSNLDSLEDQRRWIYEWVLKLEPQNAAEFVWHDSAIIYDSVYVLQRRWVSEECPFDTVDIPMYEIRWMTYDSTVYVPSVSSQSFIWITYDSTTNYQQFDPSLDSLGDQSFVLDTSISLHWDADDFLKRTGEKYEQQRCQEIWECVRKKLIEFLEE